MVNLEWGGFIYILGKPLNISGKTHPYKHF
jgi:hypothetical protein